MKKLTGFICCLMLVAGVGVSASSAGNCGANTVYGARLITIEFDDLAGSQEPEPYKSGMDDPQIMPMSLVLNPYKTVNWSTIKHFKANMHAHTTNSDGDFAPHQVVDMYHQHGYDILSITDHNRITWPWTAFSSINNVWENRDPRALGMLAVEGNELSTGHHRGSFIHAVAGDGADLVEAFKTMTKINGLGSFKHPGRYWKINHDYASGDQYSLEWYRDFYESFPAIVAMEVYNQGDRYPHDRVLWDELLTLMMPDRPIWGHSHDDMHKDRHYFRNYNYKLMPELTIEALREAMITGASYFVYEPKGDGKPKVPELDSITVDRHKREIVIHAGNYTSIEWISGISGTGADRKSRVIASGNTLNYEWINHPYVRAVIISQHGRVYTQPFGFAHRAPAGIASIEVTELNCFGSAVFTIGNDDLAEYYHWDIPKGAIAIRGEQSNTIELDLSGIKGSIEIKVHKTNPSGSSNVATLALTINEQPETPAIIQAGNVLVSTSAEGNQWYDKDGPIEGATSSELIIDREGDYYVIVTHAGCSSEKSNTISVKVNELEQIKVASLYPNPVSEKLTIRAMNEEQTLNYEILNTLGQMVKKGSFTGSTTVSTENLSRGAYIVRLSNGKQLDKIKFLKD